MNLADATQPELFKAVRACRKAGRSDEGLALLRDALRRGQLDAEGVDQAGRLIRREVMAGTAATPTRPLRILILGQCTTSWLVTSLTAVAWGQGVATVVTEGGYDTILQDLGALSPEQERPDAVVLLPWQARLLAENRPIAERVADELAFWRQAWGLVTGRLGSRLIQVGYDWVGPGALGHHLSGSVGAVAAVREANAALRESLPAGAYFLDLEQVSGMVGRDRFYDARRYYWTKQPFSEPGVLALSEHLWGGLRALTTGPKKVLVLDLDNTLWGGVVGETGPLGIALGESVDGEAFRAFQSHIKGLARRGVVLAVASKNNPADAREPFEANPDMLLKLDDFGAFEANWDPKAVTIPRIAKALELGLDSFVFFDDNPAEREQIRQALPEVAVVEVPEDPSGFVRALQAGLWFEAAALTEADYLRAGQYVVERKRRELAGAFTSMDDYLRSLEMVATVRPIDEADLQRVVQLLAKTNQFNLTTRRHTREDVQALLARPDAIGMTLRLVDRFGDYGLVAVVIAVPVEGAAVKTLRVDTWLMSCRVIGRSFEHFTCGRLIDLAVARGYRRIEGEFLPTAKNALVKDLYDAMGFDRTTEGPDRNGYALGLDGGPRPVTFVAEAEA